MDKVMEIVADIVEKEHMEDIKEAQLPQQEETKEKKLENVTNR